MKQSLLKMAAIVVPLATVLLTFQNCDQARLSLISKAEIASAKSDGEVCASLGSQNNMTKILFVVDKSGSNAGAGGTDPTKSYRVDTIKNFYTSQQSNPGIEWGFLVFQNAGARAYINDAGSETLPAFTSSPTVFNAALTQLQSEQDAGGTPYAAALVMARKAIVDDAAKMAAMPTPVKARYIVVFFSDGAPSDISTNDNLTRIVEDLRKDVSASLSTVYYGPANGAVAIERLKLMATTGEGKFLDTNVSGRIPIDGLVLFKTVEPWLIKNFTVTNLNASPCDDGTMGGDSDADGICDKDEVAYNAKFASDPIKVAAMDGKKFDPYNRNSFSANFSDAIYYRYIVYGDALPTECTNAGDIDGDLANSCEEKYLRTISPLGSTPKWTSSMGEEADPLNFDSDGDGYLDWFEFVMTRNRSAAMDHDNILQLLSNGMRLDTVFQKHLNWRNPASSPAYDGQFQFSRLNAEGSYCYTYRQTVLPLYSTGAVTTDQVSGNANLAHTANQNVIMISFIQSLEKDPNGPGELRYMFQKVSASSPQVNLNLNVEQYQSYKVTDKANVKP